MAVVDSLDECDRCAPAVVTPIAESKLYAFECLLTRRPELPIQIGLKKLGQDINHDSILIKIPGKITEHGIRLVLGENFPT